MKAIAYLLVGLVSLFCFMGSSSLKAEASDYLGDFCWQSGDVIIKLGVADMGGSHFLLAGRMTKSDGTLQNIVNGNAELIGNYIKGTLVSSGKDNIAMWTSTALITLNISDLNGTVESIGHDRNYSD